MKNIKTAAFFDDHADRWDSYNEEERVHHAIKCILDRAGTAKNDMILDVGCGTGVLLPHMLALGISLTDITCVDVSCRMLEILSSKFPEVCTIESSFENMPEDCTYSKIIIFNAFPHFDEPDTVFAKASRILADNGKLIIAHSMTREELDEHHRQAGSVVENHVLIEDSVFFDLYSRHKFKGVVVDNNTLFYSEGTRS